MDPKSPVPLAGGSQKLLIQHVDWGISDVQVEGCWLQESDALRSSKPSGTDGSLRFTH